MVKISKNSNAENTAKRKRISLACEGCRQRKSRCDGVQPTCGICLKRKIPCVYGKKYTRAHVSVEYVRELEEKLGILEKAEPKSMDLVRSGSIISEGNLNNKESDHRSSQELAHSISGADPVVAYPYTPISEPYSSNIRVVLNISNTREEGDVDRDESSTDAMGAVSGTTPNANKDKSFYGKSAAISFMKELLSSVDDTRLVDSSSADSGRLQIYKMARDEKDRSRADPYRIVVPPRSVADKYVKNYFDYAYPLYPFIHKQTFMATYEEIWSGENDGNIDELFYSIVNIIFAFGYRLSPVGEHIENGFNANVYFKRSQALLRFHLLDAGSLVLIQALLLTGQFLQGTTRLAGCWNFVGLAIRIAQGLGLHMDKSMSSLRSYIVQEIERRLWHGCLLMDKMVSMTFGRPLMVTEDLMHEPPVYIDDQYITDEDIRQRLPTDKPSVLSFFSETVKLYNILADILKTFYSNAIPEYVDIFVSIFRFQERLYDFQDNIPKHILFGNCLKEAPYQRQSIVLQIRYLHVKIMLYRPILFPNNKKNKRDYRMNHAELYLSSQRSISTLCVETAIEVINLINKYRYADITLLPAIWYNNFYIYTAASVLLAARLQPFLADIVDMGRFELAWDQGLELLSSYLTKSESASRCLKVLEMMNDKLKHGKQKKDDNINQVQHGSNSNIDPIEAPSDLLLSLMYETPAPFIDPFIYSEDFETLIV